MTAGSFSARFWAKVRKTDTCWLWDGYLNKSGYGALAIGGRGGGQIGAHRASYIITHGSIPPGLHVCHRCDVPACVNPDHLFVGTAADNIRDMESKGRGRHPAGEGHVLARLTWPDVLEIRSLAEHGWGYGRLSARFGTSRANIRNIVLNRKWRTS